MNTAQGNIDIFCRMVEERSREHLSAMAVVAEQGWWSVAAGILRQELDSVVRVIYLLNQRHDVRDQLIESCVNGIGFGQPRVTDRRMVDDIEEIPELRGWTDWVYRFGNSFIHLSADHDYLSRDPFQARPEGDREEIAKYLRHYHGGSASTESTFQQVAAYAPAVLTKISSSLRNYLSDLQRLYR